MIAVEPAVDKIVTTQKIYYDWKKEYIHYHKIKKN